MANTPSSVNITPGAGKIMATIKDGANKEYPSYNTRLPLTGAIPNNATVGTSSAVAIAANANRLGVMMTNLGSDTIFLACDQAALANKGIPIFPYQSRWMDEYWFTVGDIYAISNSAGQTLAYQEFI